MRWLTKNLTTAFSLVFGAMVLPGVHLGEDLWTIVIVTLLSGFFNAVVKPLFVLLTIPVTIVTMGVFLLAVNAIMLLMVDGLVDGFSIDTFWWALALSGIVAAVRSMVEWTEKSLDDYYRENPEG